jgi:cell division protease FtsH
MRATSSHLPSSLAREDGARRRWEVRGAIDPEDPVDALMNDLTGSERPEMRRPELRADLAAAGILVARALERQPEILRLLRRAAQVVVIETGSTGTVGLVKRVIRSSVFPPDFNVRLKGAMAWRSIVSRSSRPRLKHVG